MRRIEFLYRMDAPGVGRVEKRDVREVEDEAAERLVNGGFARDVVAGAPVDPPLFERVLESAGATPIAPNMAVPEKFSLIGEDDEPEDAA